MGMYTASSHSAENQSIAENLMRSAKPPTTSAGVMTAKVIWNIANSDSGMVPLSVSSPMPDNMTRDRSPMNPLPPLNARL